MSLALFVAIADGKHLFLLTINMVFIFIKASLLEESLSQKKIRNLLFLYIVKNEAKLDINLCSIKLHELCEFDQKNLHAE